MTFSDTFSDRVIRDVTNRAQKAQEHLRSLRKAQEKLQLAEGLNGASGAKALADAYSECAAICYELVKILS